MVANEKITLQANKRTLLGKKAKQLRPKGLTPGNIFGSDFKSISVEVNTKDFIHVFKTAKETGIVYINVDKDTVPTLIKDVQKHPIDNHIQHVDFRKINLKQKIETEVPVQVIGTSIAVSQLGGVLLTQSNHLMIEALPTDIPQAIEVDISGIKEIGQEIKVSDLPKSDKYVIKEEPDKVVISVTQHKEESVTPETATATGPEIITEKAPEEGTATDEAAPETKKE